MRSFSGRVIEIHMDQRGSTSAWIACPTGAIPGPGQYVLACDPEDLDTPLAVPLFPADFSNAGFLSASPIPRAWEPGTRLELWGVLGQGFHVPAGIQRLACSALGGSMARLLPLVGRALSQGVAVVLFTDLPLPSLASDLEVQPLSALSDSLDWPDFLALDLPVEQLPALRSVLGVHPSSVLPCPGQALVLTPMPCGGMAECGACAVPVHGAPSHSPFTHSGGKLS